MVNLKSKKLLAPEIFNQLPSPLDLNLNYCVGLSGGVDSVVLLNLLANFRNNNNLRLSAIHINHGISAHAAKWEQFCVELCQELKIPLVVKQLKITKTPGQGLENSARILRYQEYYKTHSKVIVLAHHQNDQIETLLVQLLRGSNLYNLGAMQQISFKKEHFFWRPLLDFTKDAIYEYANSHKLNFIEDESNLDPQYLRNFLRLKIIPQLKEYDLNLNSKLISSLNSIQQSLNLQDEIAKEDLAYNSKILLINYLKLSNARQLNLLSYFIRKSGLPLPSSRQLVEFNFQIITAKLDRKPSLKLGKNQQIIRTSKEILISDLN